MKFILYLSNLRMWGTTWIAIKWQTGVVAPPVSIAFRFIRWSAPAVIGLALVVLGNLIAFNLFRRLPLFTGSKSAAAAR